MGTQINERKKENSITIFMLGDRINIGAYIHHVIR